MRIYILRVRYISSELEANEELKNPMAAAGAVKDALATGGVDKVTRWLLPSKTLQLLELDFALYFKLNTDHSHLTVFFS